MRTLWALVCALHAFAAASLFSSAALAVPTVSYITAEAMPCDDYPACSGTHSVQVARAGGDYEKVCKALWASIEVKWPGVSYLPATASGHCWFNNNGPTLVFGWWSATQMHDPQNQGPCDPCDGNPICAANHLMRGWMT